MHRRTRTNGGLRRGATAAALSTLLLAAQAQPAPMAADPIDLKQAFDAAWARQPESLSLPARRDAARAQQIAARSWTPEPAALELSNKTDRLNRNQGARELEVGVAVPLWLPGERSRSGALAEAEAAAIESHTSAAQLSVAASVREAWWAWQRARIDADIARDQLDNAERIAVDVSRRARAGDLARADQHQADGAVAAAESSLAQAQATLVAARQQLKAGTGMAAPAESATTGPVAEPEPDAGPTGETDTHAVLRELQDRAAVAERTAQLASAQSRANPELTLAGTRERGADGEANQQSITLGLRIPFGGGPRHDTRVARARAEALELQARLTLERERLLAEREAARGRVDAARTQLAASERRARLARESRGFFDKSFRLGETDLPTRLRIEAEAADAERQAARTRIELAASISAWRQALGLLPQ
ncbi:TolC family protein [Methylibium sp.]|uniref:TolC family protein n=1 Tax=Methylibium sp. TaxID=2067992 RepID=UPI003BAD9082